MLLRRLIASALIAESMFNGLYCAGRLPLLRGYDAVAILLIVLRGFVGAIQFTGGWTTAINRPQGVPIARAALLAAAVLTTFDVGFNLAPTSVYPWWRTQVAIGYWVYAGIAWTILRPRP